MTNTRPIRVMIVDDHQQVRKALRLTLSTLHGLILVGEAPNGKKAVSQYVDLTPDVILMDLIMPEMDGVAAIRVIHQERPGIRIIGLTGTESADLMRSALDAGAVDCLNKACTVGELEAAIRGISMNRDDCDPQPFA